MPRKVALLVADSGGHLDQLHRLEARLHPRFDAVTYVTSFTDQSRSLLDGRDIRFVPRVPPRGALVAARSLAPAARQMRELGATHVISTGSAIAVPYLIAARALRLDAHYIESATRTDGPSLSGKILQRVPGVHLYTQHRQWADRSWLYRGSVLDGFTLQEGAAHRRLDRVVVTLGTMSRFPFERAVQAVRRVLARSATPHTRILWQIGDAAAHDLPGEVRSTVPAARLRAEIADADLVFAHAGTGSSLQILDAGRVPLLLPRSASRGEHVDDHQSLIARELASRGLAVTADPDHLSTEHVQQALGLRVLKNTSAARFDLTSISP